MLVELRQTYEREVTPKPGENVLFTNFMCDWLKIVKPNLEITTYSSYKSYVTRLNKYFEIKNILLKDLAAKDIQEFYTYMFTENHVTANTVIHYHANIRKALQYAVKMGYISANPALYVDRPKIQKFVGSVYDVDEINELLTIVKGMKIEMGIMFTS